MRPPGPGLQLFHDKTSHTPEVPFAGRPHQHRKVQMQSGRRNS